MMNKNSRAFLIFINPETGNLLYDEIVYVDACVDIFDYEMEFENPQKINVDYSTNMIYYFKPIKTKKRGYHLPCIKIVNIDNDYIYFYNLEYPDRRGSSKKLLKITEDANYVYCCEIDNNIINMSRLNNRPQKTIQLKKIKKQDIDTLHLRWSVEKGREGTIKYISSKRLKSSDFNNLKIHLRNIIDGEIREIE